MAKTNRNKTARATPRRVGNYRGGLKVPQVSTGPVNQMKNLIARSGQSAPAELLASYNEKKNGGRSAMIAMTKPNTRSKKAGLMVGPYGTGDISWGSSALPVYMTSYATGSHWGSGTRDVPPYFALMNEMNGGILYWPVTLRERYEWYRYFARTDAYVARACELMTDLPLSKLSLNMPKMEGKPRELKTEIYDFYNDMIDRLNLFERLQQLLWEWNVIGNVFIYHEWDDDRKSWANLVILPPEEISVFQYPFSEETRIEYRPERLIRMIQATRDEGSAVSGYNEADQFVRNIVDRVPREIRDMIHREGCIVMDSDPMTGSFCCHMARRKPPYFDLGASILERVLVPLLMKEHFKYTQLSLSSRNMTPKNLISAQMLNAEELDDLRTQVDLSYLDPDYSIVVNYPVEWQTIGAGDRLLELGSEYEQIENQVFAGLGVTREILTGEGTYSGTRITVEIMNTMYLIIREILQKYVEKKLFMPVAEAHKWFDVDKNGIKHYWYPKLGFNRLTIRDNQEVFDSLYQLYQKGSLPVDVIYELFNLDTETIHDRIFEEVFTVKDSTFNRLLEEVNSEMGRNLVDKSDILDKMIKYLKLNKVEQQEGAGGMGAPMGAPLGQAQEGQPKEGQPEEDAQSQPVENKEDESEIDELSDEIAKELPADASDEDIHKALEKKMKEKSEEKSEGKSEEAPKGDEEKPEKTPKKKTEEKSKEAPKEKVMKKKAPEAPKEKLKKPFKTTEKKKDSEPTDKDVDIDKLSDELAKELPMDASEEDMHKALEEKMKEKATADSE